MVKLFSALYLRDELTQKLLCSSFFKRHYIPFITTKYFFGDYHYAVIVDANRKKIREPLGKRDQHEIKLVLKPFI